MTYYAQPFSIAFSAPPRAGRQDWSDRHNSAIGSPANEDERRTVSLLREVYSAARSYSEGCYLGERHIAEPLIRAARFALNYDLGRLDAGVLDRALCHLAEMLNIDLDS